MREKRNLDELIAKEEAKLEKLEERQADIAKKIKAGKAAIENYTLMKNHQQFNELSNALDESGFSIEDILSAVTAGGMDSLQKKMSSKKAGTEEDDAATSA